MLFVLISVMFLLVFAPIVFALFAPPRQIGKHRSTPGQLMLQDAQRAEREAEHAQAIVRADLIANGSRADWVMVEG